MRRSPRTAWLPVSLQPGFIAPSYIPDLLRNRTIYGFVKISNAAFVYTYSFSSKSRRADAPARVHLHCMFWGIWWLACFSGPSRSRSE